MPERPLLMVRGHYNTRHLIRYLGEQAGYRFLLFSNQLDAADLRGLEWEPLELPEPGPLAVARAAAERHAAGLRVDPAALPSWCAPETADDLQRAARAALPAVLQFIELMKARHARTPIRVLIVNHDQDLANGAALETARALGIPSLHVMHCHTFRLVRSGMCHDAGNADVTAVWSDQCRADLPPIGRLRHRVVATGAPMLDPLFAYADADGRRRAREALRLQPDVPVVTYASSYESGLSVGGRLAHGRLGTHFRRFLEAFKFLSEERPLQLVVKLHPVLPSREQHLQDLAEAGIPSALVTAGNNPAVLAASDLLVSFYPSAVMQDAAMVGTLSLWVRAELSCYPLYGTCASVMKITADEFSRGTLRRALFDEAYRSQHRAHLADDREFYNFAADGQASERVRRLVDRMAALTDSREKPWGRFYHARRDHLLLEAELANLVAATESGAAPSSPA